MSHHEKDEPKTKAESQPQADDEKDVEGHNIFATHDYYVQRNVDRRSEIDRDVRDRQRAKEAEDNKKKGR